MIRSRRRTILCLLLLLIQVYLGVRALFFLSLKATRTITSEIHDGDQLYFFPKTCFSKLQHGIVRRAILVHFPVERSAVYLSELKWLYLSWINTIKTQPSQWRTDLLIYSLPTTILDDLGCHSIDQRLNGDQCFRIDYTSLWDRIDSSSDALSASIRAHVPSWCRHLDSLGILLEQSSVLDGYDYILRTDLDVFLTPEFAHYIPFDCSFQIGLGGYSLDYTVNKLIRIAKVLQLSNANLTHVGSTWYAPPKQAILAARLALWLSIWLSQNEFTVVERDQRLSILSWPQWYIGVISMYASHLSLNHLGARGQINLVQRPFLMDHSCTTNESFHVYKIIHIHAWHTNTMFSKFSFKNGSYDELLRGRTEWNTNYSLDYVLHIAWQSKQLSLQELFDLKRQLST